MQTLKLVLCASVVLTCASARAAGTVVTLSFDDTFADQQQAATALDAHGMRGTFYVNSPRIGEPGFLTLAQLMAMQSAGHEIAGHTVNHLTLTTLTVDEQQRQICNDRADLLKMGLQVVNLAYPHGAADQDTYAVALQCGYASARDASGLQSIEGCPTCPIVETIPPQTMMSIRTPASVKSTWTLADLQQIVTRAEGAGGGWVPFVFHHVCDGCNTLAVSPAVLTAFLDWLAPRAASGTVVKTIQDVIAGPMNPGVYGPVASVYVGANDNLLHDDSLEADADGNGVPDCWQVAAEGADASTYSTAIVPGAHSGSSAFQLSVTPGKSSAPRLWSQQDLGQCAPPAAPGHTFNASAWYQATDPPVFMAYYRNTLGWWKPLGMSTPLPASSSWAQATWTTPPIPADGTAVSIAVSIQTTGTLTIDDLTLVDPAGVPMMPPPPDGSVVSALDAGPPGSVTDAAAPADAGMPFEAADAGVAPPSPPPGANGCDMGGDSSSGVLSLLLLLIASLALRVTPKVE